MNIEQKLKLSQSTDTIYFFRDGFFVRFFAVSLYLAKEQLALDVKVCGRRYKKLANQLILQAGYPQALLQQSYPNLIQYDFGYGLKGDWPFDLTRYKTWHQHHFTVIRTANAVAKNKTQILS